ncbi:MAG: hypothetical protein FQY80_06695 [Ornithobacterium rhinotracheale]|nr:hypothetical protein [Ornithobacterium rhinotracheale]
MILGLSLAFVKISIALVFCISPVRLAFFSNFQLWIFSEVGVALKVLLKRSLSVLLQLSFEAKSSIFLENFSSFWSKFTFMKSLSTCSIKSLALILVATAGSKGLTEAI